MLVYANHLSFSGPSAESAALKAVGAWVKQQLGLSKGLHPDQLTNDGGEHTGYRGDSRSWLKIYAADQETPKLYAWVLKVQDNTVRGRQWVVELGLKTNHDHAELSCVTRTEDQSTLIDEPVSASQPRVIPYLVKNIGETADTKFNGSVAGLSLKTVGEDPASYRGLLAEIERQERDYPIVLVSPTTEGDYLLDIDWLQKALFGLAQVVQVATDFDSFQMEEVLGRQWSAWNGAVNVIHTPARSGYVRGRFFLTREIESWGDTPNQRISHILSWVTANTNIPNLRNRIRPEGVARLRDRRHLNAVRQRSSQLGTEQLRAELETASKLEQENSEWIKALEMENERLDSEIREANAKIEEAEQNLWGREATITALKEQLRNAGATTSVESEVDFLVSLAARGDEPTPRECLEVLQNHFSDKCVILESAKKSAEEMNRFAKGRKLLGLLVRLVTDYRSALMERGDSEARKCFGAKEFAATESETVTKNRSMRAARTFPYKDNDIEMFRHLKIGIDDDESKTIRVHFHWDNDDQRIIIGYCGTHLPVASH